MEQKRQASKKHRGIIVINGRRYDAHSGTPISDQAQKVISDIGPKTQRPTAPISKTVHKSLQRSHTLMRRAAKKSAALITHPQSTVEVAENHLLDIPSVPSKSESSRLKRANQIKRSNLVSRYGNTLKKPVSADDFSRDVKNQTVQSMDVVPVPIHQKNTHPQQTKVAKRKTPTEKLLEHGLRSAASHETIKSHKAHAKQRSKKFSLRRKTTRYAAGALATLLFVGFFGYQNMPNLSVRYASLKAGVDASLPGYKPAGFAINDRVEYKSGEVALTFKANADDRSFKIIQQKSDLDNEALKQQLSQRSGYAPQTYPDNGKTIYFYGDSNASWVSDGVLYNIVSDANLNTSQLLKIADSL
jgi:hypothetical protein